MENKVILRIAVTTVLVIAIAVAARMYAGRHTVVAPVVSQPTVSHVAPMHNTNAVPTNEQHAPATGTEKPK